MCIHHGAVVCAGGSWPGLTALLSMFTRMPSEPCMRPPRMRQSVVMIVLVGDSTGHVSLGVQVDG